MKEILDKLESIEMLLLSNKSVLSFKEAARYLGLSESYLYHLCSDKEIPHYKRGRLTFFKKTDLDDWALGEKVSSNNEISIQAYKIKEVSRKRCEA